MEDQNAAAAPRRRTHQEQSDQVIQDAIATLRQMNVDAITAYQAADISSATRQKARTIQQHTARALRALGE